MSNNEAKQKLRAALERYQQAKKNFEEEQRRAEEERLAAIQRAEEERAYRRWRRIELLKRIGGVLLKLTGGAIGVALGIGVVVLEIDGIIFLVEGAINILAYVLGAVVLIGLIWLGPAGWAILFLIWLFFH